MDLLWFLLFSLILHISRSKPYIRVLLDDFIEGNQILTSELIKKMEIGRQNFAISPFALQTSMAVLLTGANNKTEFEILNTMKFTKRDRRQNNAIRIVNQLLREYKNITQLQSVINIFINDSIKLNPSFIKLIQQTFFIDLQQVNFSKRRQAVRILNNWVQEQTNRKIKNLTSIDDIKKPTTALVLSTLYFSKKFRYSFNAFCKPYKLNFINIDGSSAIVTGMHLERDFTYAETDFAQWLQIPFIGPYTIMHFLLPKSTNFDVSISRNSPKVDTQIIQEIFENVVFVERCVQVILPKFRIDHKTNLKQILQEMGSRAMFRKKADFPFFVTNSSTNFFVNDVLQKISLTISNFGVQIEYPPSNNCSIPARTECKKFHVNRPFYFLIARKGVVLFAGRISKL